MLGWQRYRADQYQEYFEMVQQRLVIDSIPAIVWGKQSNKAYLFVHGKMSCKEEAELFASIAEKHGYQVISFDLPEHGERKSENYPCSVQNGVQDLTRIINHVSSKWATQISLYACSLGAYFSLIAYRDIVFEKCLFQSPILDMERLINNMMKWFDVSESDLKSKKEIPTPIGETLSWDYLMYVRDNRIEKWNSRTKILYGEKDNLTERDVIDSFLAKYKADLWVVKNGEHYFHSDKEVNELKEWIENNV